ncbi:hypothetical protein MMC17_003100 [Xylographa soralifera]|nr:hypothetical protein [Xylographa soralifera]
MASNTANAIWQWLAKKLRLNKRDDGSMDDVIESGTQEGITSVQPQPTPFTSSAFTVLPAPLPVEDVFVLQAWPISAIRATLRSLVLWVLIVTWYYYGMQLGIFILVVFGSRYLLLKTGVETIAGVPIPGTKQLASAISRWPQKIWVLILTRLFKLPLVHRVWWGCYLWISEISEFKQNYIEAWKQHQRTSINIYINYEHLVIPIPEENTDEAVLRQLRMFYRMVQVERGIPGLLIPKQLDRIDVVEMTPETSVLGYPKETLRLGRYESRLIDLFEHPEHGKSSTAIAEKIRGLSEDAALEFR